jgi:hypothetical protein
MKHSYAEYVTVFMTLLDETHMKIIYMLSYVKMCVGEIPYKAIYNEIENVCLLNKLKRSRNILCLQNIGCSEKLHIAARVVVFSPGEDVKLPKGG